VSKTLSLRDAVAPILIGVGVAVSVIACSPTHSTPHPTPGQSAVAKSDAKALAAKCVPTGATQQIELAHSLTTQSGRAALEAKCGVPASHKTAFESQVLAAAESGHLTTHSGRTTFFSVTLPKIVEANQG
jgi:hypothetical protein